jgi:hypothetical protein
MDELLATMRTIERLVGERLEEKAAAEKRAAAFEDMAREVGDYVRSRIAYSVARGYTAVDLGTVDDAITVLAWLGQPLEVPGEQEGLEQYAGPYRRLEALLKAAVPCANWLRFFALRGFRGLPPAALFADVYRWQEALARDKTKLGANEAGAAAGADDDQVLG